MPKFFDKKLAGRLLGLPLVAMTTTVVYHTFAMPFSMQRGRPLKFVVYHRVVLGVEKQHSEPYVFVNFVAVRGRIASTIMNYGSIWIPFPPSVRGTDALYRH